MKKSLLSGLLAATIAITTPSISIAKSSVWKVSKNNTHLFLGGTVHILSADDYPLPCEFGAAYSVSEKLFFETDFSAEKLLQAGTEMLKQGVYPQGDGLANRLSDKTLTDLKEHLTSLGLPAEQFLNFKPGVLLSFITVAQLNNIGIQTAGVDKHYYDLAKKDKKATGYFEEINEQISFLVKMGIDNEENFIRYTLEGMENLETQFLGMRESWRNGNTDLLADFSELDELRSKFPAVFETLLTSRNEQWLTRVDSLIESAEVEYILVGALHLAGPEGLLARLESKGYQIDQLSCTYKR